MEVAVGQQNFRQPDISYTFSVCFNDFPFNENFKFVSISGVAMLVKLYLITFSEEIKWKTRFHGGVDKLNLIL